MSQYIQPYSYERRPESSIPRELRERVNLLSWAVNLIRQAIPAPAEPVAPFMPDEAPMGQRAAQTVLGDTVKTENTLEPSVPKSEVMTDNVDEAQARVDAAFAEVFAKNPALQQQAAESGLLDVAETH